MKINDFNVNITMYKQHFFKLFHKIQSLFMTEKLDEAYHHIYVERSDRAAVHVVPEGKTPASCG